MCLRFVPLVALVLVLVFVAQPRPVCAETAYPVGTGLEIAPYGQFHFAYQSFDDGQIETANIVDITNANSRIGFYLRTPGRSDGLSFHFESGLGFRPSQKTSQINTPEFWNWQRTDLRKVQLVWKGRFGTLKLGQGSMTSDGAAESDLGKTVIVAKSTIPEANGAYIFRTGTGALSNVTIGQTFSNFDGGRQGRIRYDSPYFAGFSIGLAYGREILKSGVDDDYYDIALRYAKEFQRLKVTGAASFAYLETATFDESVAIGSLAIYDKPTGLNAALAVGREHKTGANYAYLKLGWNTKVMQSGETRFVFESFRGADYLTQGAQSDMWGLGVIQSFEALRTEVYLGYRAFSYDDTTAVTYQDANAVQFGARFRF